MHPLKITAKLQNNICGNDPCFPIDGVLLYAELVELYGKDISDPKITGELLYPDSMPITKRHENTDFWYYAASFAQYENQGEYIQHWHKRFRNEYAHLIDFRGRRGRVRISQGEYKVYRMPLISYVVDLMEWYVIGEKNRIIFLLKSIQYLGKKRSQGQGLVLEWDVEEMSEDWSEKKDGRWTRSVPCNALEKINLAPGIHFAYRSFRPPYWHPDSFAMCTVQGETAKNERISIT